MADLWFGSDWHLWHENIIQYANRPFVNAKEMTETLLDYHNQLVRPQDHYTHLGDVTMARGNKVTCERALNIVHSFNGHKRLILGNHDLFPTKYYLEYFEKVLAMNMLDGIRFTHIPIHPLSMGRATANVHGHIHERTNYPPVEYCREDGSTTVRPFINISVEVTNYRPVHFEDIKKLIKEAKARKQPAQV